MTFFRVFGLPCAALLLAGCEVEPSAPEGTPILTVTEIKRGGTTAIAFTSDDTQTPERTTCADGSLPGLVAGWPDTRDTWNDYYVLEPGQTEATFLMSVRSRSGVSTWIMTVASGFDVVDPEPRPVDVIPERTLFSFDLGGRFFNPTLRSMTLRLAENAAPSQTAATITTILTTGGGRNLDADDQTWTLIAGC